jgi:hypothetical protein
MMEAKMLKEGTVFRLESETFVVIKDNWYDDKFDEISKTDSMNGYAHKKNIIGLVAVMPTPIVNGSPIEYRIVKLEYNRLIVNGNVKMQGYTRDFSDKNWIIETIPIENTVPLKDGDSEEEAKKYFDKYLIEKFV